ncbi:MAG TPA: helix-turn-helix transcriptional regulator [Chloroflexia bacterium]|nr:helix-turn-helix transcriptional regulator [Chloroflexia bacterium]
MPEINSHELQSFYQVLDEIDRRTRAIPNLPAGMSFQEKRARYGALFVQEIADVTEALAYMRRTKRFTPGDLRRAELYIQLLATELQIIVRQREGLDMPAQARGTPEEEMVRLKRLKELERELNILLEEKRSLERQLGALAGTSDDYAPPPELPSQEVLYLREKGYSSPYYPRLDLPAELRTCGALVYTRLREALALNTFEKYEGIPWPTADLGQHGSGASSRRLAGVAQLLPSLLDDHKNRTYLPPEEQETLANLMWQQQAELSDLDADVLDLLCHLWLLTANEPNTPAIASVDQLLDLRGLKAKLSGNKRRGGYLAGQRAEILKALEHIQNLWLDLGQVEIFESDGKRTRPVLQTIQSRVFVIIDRKVRRRAADQPPELDKFLYQPGRLFAGFLLGPSRQVTLLSSRAVAYDPYRQKWEKRLTRYLSWQWRIKASQGETTHPYRVRTLLQAVGVKLQAGRPYRIKERLEKALDTLRQDKVMAQWQYDPSGWNEEWVEERGWAQHWEQSLVIIELPEIIREAYQKIEAGRAEYNRAKETAALPPAHQKEASIAKALRERRKALGLSQLELAERLEVTQGYLSKLEKGQATATPALLKRLKAWLAASQAGS